MCQARRRYRARVQVVAEEDAHGVRDQRIFLPRSGRSVAEAGRAYHPQ